LNEKEPEQINDLLEPDYKGMKIFKPVFDNFKEVFFYGGNSDPELAVKPKRAAAKGAKAKVTTKVEF
jgi:hypothetical protein